MGQNTQIQPQQIDRTGLLRAAATSMSTALVLAVLGSSNMMYYFGLFFGLVSIIFMIGALINNKWTRRQIEGLNSGLNMIFLLMSIISIITNWTKFTGNLNSLIKNGNLPSWFGWAYLNIPVPWIIVFAIIFAIVVIIELRGRLKTTPQRSPTNLVVSSIGLFIGVLYVVFPFTNLAAESACQNSY